MAEFRLIKNRLLIVFMNYLKDGLLGIDNKQAENAIRPIALGRKNYLFTGSSRGAIFYSFFNTCKINGLNSFDWLKKFWKLYLNTK